MDKPPSVKQSGASEKLSRRVPRTIHRPDYTAVARATQERVDWTREVRCSNWKWVENARDFSVYTKRDTAPSSTPLPEGAGFSVLATGVVHASVRELASLLSSSSQREYERTMSAYHGKEFKRGTYIADVSNDEPVEDDGVPSARLSLRTATFASSDWLRREEEWCYLDATTSDMNDRLFEKLTTSLKQEDLVIPDGGRVPEIGRGKRFRNVIIAYRVQAEEFSDADLRRQRGVCARVHFFATIAPPSSGGSSPFGSFAVPSTKHDASTKTIQSRMLSLARNCARLSALVRRRRLGVQVLMDPHRVPSLSNRACIQCEKVILLAKLCRVCGHSVCKDCSEKYERETRRPCSSVTRLEKVRVCDLCLARIERADYSGITDGSLAEPSIFPDKPSGSNGVIRTAGSDLKRLLHDALASATSSQRKDAVRSVIQCVLDQERDHVEKRPRTKSSVSSTVSTTSSTDLYTSAALDDFTLENIPSGDAELSCRHGRSYPLDPHDETAFPVPHNETDRLQAIDRLGVLTHGDWAELDIVCDLAAKEVGAFASIVSIITHDEQRVVAANSPHFRAFKPKRHRSFCTHTIMDNKPLIVPHPEADFRLSHIAREWDLGVRFYCGFPLLVDGATPIGTLCCVDRESHELTEAQFTALQRLAETATKIIRLAAAARK